MDKPEVENPHLLCSFGSVVERKDDQVENV